MIGGYLKTASRVAMGAAAGIFIAGSAITPAMAADLGGDCCADLEERVADLEATTVRKGNRKVSVVLYGQVNRALLYWDDGKYQNIYSVDNDQSSTRLGVKGKGTALPGLTAGYKIEFEVTSAASNTVSQNDDDGFFGLDVRHAFVYLKGHWGKISLGQTSQTTAGITEVDVSGAKVIATARGIRWHSSFFLRDANTNGLLTRTWGNISPIRGHMGGTRRDLIRYDSPELHGFTLSASWGEDDYWDVALRYAQSLGQFNVAAGIGYRRNNGLHADGGGDSEDGGNDNRGSDILSGSLGVIHVPTGLNINFAAGQTQHDVSVAHRTAGRTYEDTNFWYIKGGIYQNFFGIGRTSLYGEYYESKDACSGTAADATVGSCGSTAASLLSQYAANPANFDHVTSDKQNFWGLGAVQHLPNAATELYVGYRHYTSDVKVATDQAGTQGTAVNLDDLDMVMGGMRIRF